MTRPNFIRAKNISHMFNTYLSKECLCFQHFQTSKHVDASITSKHMNKTSIGSKYVHIIVHIQS